MDYSSPFNRRIAFVSVDNAVEQTLRTYLSLPERHFRNTSAPLPVADDADFREICDAVFSHCKALQGKVKKSELVKYHELRNVIYHRSVGSDVDSRFLEAYFETARLLLSLLLNTRADAFTVVLAAFREDIVAELEAEWRKERSAQHSRRVRGGIRRLTAEGREFGRPRKNLSEAEIKLATRLRQELRWGADSIAGELSRRRGSHLLTDPSARVEAAVSPTLVRVRLSEIGKWKIEGKSVWGRKSLPEGFL